MVAMNRTRRHLVAFLLATPFGAGAARLRRIVMFADAPAERAEFTRRAIAAVLAEEGFVEGRDIVIEVVNLHGRTQQAARLADAVVASQPDLIAVSSTDNTRLFQQRTTRIPIVFRRVGDPVGAGLVQSLARPGGNLTGVANQSFTLEGKRLEILKALRPGLRRVAVLRAEGPIAELSRRSQDEAARTLGLTLEEILLPPGRDDPADFEREVFNAQAQGAIIQFINNDSPRLPAFLAALQARGIAAMFLDHQVVRAGGLVSLGERTDRYDPEPARIMARILRGERPANIPVSLMARIHLALNLRTARAMNLTVPESVRLQVDELIE